MKVVEYRTRTRRAPGGEFRLVLGHPTSVRERNRLLKLRDDVCKRLADRGEWSVLEAVKRRQTTLEGT